METVLTKKHTRRGEAEETGEGELQEKTGHLRETRRGHPQERRAKREETESQGSRPKEERQQAERFCLGTEPQRQALPTGLASLKLTFTSKNWPLSIRRRRRSSPVKWKHLCRLLRLSLPTLSRTPPGKVSLHFPAGVRRRLSPFRSRRSAAPRLGCPHTAWHSDGDRASRDASRRLLEQTETQKPVAGTEFFPACTRNEEGKSWWPPRRSWHGSETAPRFRCLYSGSSEQETVSECELFSDGRKGFSHSEAFSRWLCVEGGPTRAERQKRSRWEGV
ncbi:hypothetical protein TGVAND_286170, partial [Toxoplasma gondii VAND]